MFSRFLARSPPDQLRVHCVTALALDAVFFVLYLCSLKFAISDASSMECLKTDGHHWHDVLTLCLVISAIVALAGMTYHGHIACSRPATAVNLWRVGIFGWVLTCWIFVCAIVEIITFNEQPEACISKIEEATAGQSLWDVICLFLVFFWLVITLRVGNLARLCDPTKLNEERHAQGERNHAIQTEVVGIPIQGTLPSGSIVEGAALARHAGSSSGVP